VTGDEVIGFDPVRTEPRGEFPAHDDARAARRTVLTAEQARTLARDRLNRWRATHPGYGTGADHAQ
jgi:predicted dithiol-disulfide oxidoreductase (DUF899 family)